MVQRGCGSGKRVWAFCVFWSPIVADSRRWLQIWQGDGLREFRKWGGHGGGGVHELSVRGEVEEVKLADSNCN